MTEKSTPAFDSTPIDPSASACPRQSFAKASPAARCTRCCSGLPKKRTLRFSLRAYHKTSSILLKRKSPAPTTTTRSAAQRGTLGCRNAPRAVLRSFRRALPDGAVAREVSRTLTYLGWTCERFEDCGVAGLWRIQSVIDEINKADVVVVAAGLDAALASVLGG